MTRMLIGWTASAALLGQHHRITSFGVPWNSRLMSSPVTSALETCLSGLFRKNASKNDDCTNKNDNDGIFLLDGGTGEELFRRGVPDDRKIWSATAVVNEQYHDVLKNVHRSFLDAGANAITTNTYGLVPGVGFELQDMARHCATAGRLARQVVLEETEKGNNNDGCFVLGSLGPLVESYRPDLIRKHEDGVVIYKEMIVALAPFVDAFLAETLSSVEESMQPADALAQAAQLDNDDNGALQQQLPLLISYTLNSQGKLRSQEPVDQALPRILDYCEQRKVRLLAILFNCCEPEAITLALQTIQASPALQEKLASNQCLLGAYANRLTPVDPNWTMATSTGPQPFRQDLDPHQYCTHFAQSWCNEYQVRLIGGCCGITPEHIAYLKQNLLIQRVPPREQQTE